MAMKLSIIVPVYNAEKWLRNTIDSILDSRYSNIEVICVNDVLSSMVVHASHLTLPRSSQRRM